MKRGVRSESKAPFAIVKSISALPNKRRKSGASRTYAQRRNQTNPPYQVTSPPDQLELLRASAAAPPSSTPHRNRVVPHLPAERDRHPIHGEAPHLREAGRNAMHDQRR